MTVRVFVAPERCQGHLRCNALLPEIFSVDEQGHAFTSADGEVPPEHQDRARQAEGNCPERAIRIEI